MAIKATHPDYDAAALACARAHGSQPVKPRLSTPGQPSRIPPNQKSKIKNQKSPHTDQFHTSFSHQRGVQQKHAARRPLSDKSPIKKSKIKNEVRTPSHQTKTDQNGVKRTKTDLKFKPV
jgi:hypothetical protein